MPRFFGLAARRWRRRGRRGDAPRPFLLLLRRRRTVVGLCGGCPCCGRCDHRRLCHGGGGGLLCFGLSGSSRHRLGFFRGPRPRHRGFGLRHRCGLLRLIRRIHQDGRRHFQSGTTGRRPSSRSVVHRRLPFLLPNVIVLLRIRIRLRLRRRVAGVVPPGVIVSAPRIVGFFFPSGSGGVASCCASLVVRIHVRIIAEEGEIGAPVVLEIVVLVFGVQGAPSGVFALALRAAAAVVVVVVVAIFLLLVAFCSARSVVVSGAGLVRVRGVFVDDQFSVPALLGIRRAQADHVVAVAVAVAVTIAVTVARGPVCHILFSFLSLRAAFDDSPLLRIGRRDEIVVLVDLQRRPVPVPVPVPLPRRRRRLERKPPLGPQPLQFLPPSLFLYPLPTLVHHGRVLGAVPVRQRIQPVRLLLVGVGPPQSRMKEYPTMSLSPPHAAAGTPPGAPHVKTPEARLLPRTMKLGVGGMLPHRTHRASQRYAECARISIGMLAHLAFDLLPESEDVLGDADPGRVALGTLFGDDDEVMSRTEPGASSRGGVGRRGRGTLHFHVSVPLALRLVVLLILLLLLLVVVVVVALPVVLVAPVLEATVRQPFRYSQKHRAQGMHPRGPPRQIPSSIGRQDPMTSVRTVSIVQRMHRVNSGTDGAQCAFGRTIHLPDDDDALGVGAVAVAGAGAPPEPAPATAIAIAIAIAIILVVGGGRPRRPLIENVPPDVRARVTLKVWILRPGYDLGDGSVARLVVNEHTAIPTFLEVVTVEAVGVVAHVASSRD
mmetsp:Transcript_41157/g.124374  ORF Transcript_41157/g.124374 Transcript_41157/m.124374 type:complete len:771 (-) Transcript_41157:176-2488(-)